MSKDGLGSEPSATDAAWPTATDGQTAVTVLGCYHMDNPGLDAFEIAADDVLTPERQRELAALADRLADWAPDAVAVERPQARQADVTDAYERYHAGEVAYDEAVEIDPPHPDRDEPATECRSEVVQIGFRLADRLDHDTVHAVDHPTTMGANFDDEELADLDVRQATLAERAAEATAVSLPDMAAFERELTDHLADATVVEHLRYLNRERQTRRNHGTMLGQTVAGGERRYVGARMLSAWYERNLRILENLWRATDESTDRALLVIGAAHVRVLDHLLDETPMFRPVDALDLLAE